jgi:poly(3-hydroxybutyrate) depolymerase
VISKVGKESVAYAPLQSVIDKWKEINRCATQTAVTAEGLSTITTWDCQNSTVALRVLSGGDYTWPGATLFALLLIDSTPPQPLGPIIPDMSLNASQVITDFFAAHPQN